MNLLKESVVHRTYGEGTVVALVGDRMTVHFEKEVEDKKFPYPNAFDKFLKMSNPTAQKAVDADLLDFQAEQLQAEMEHITEMQAEEQRRQELLEAQKKPVKKTAAKTTKTTKTTKAAKEKAEAAAAAEEAAVLADE